MRAIRHLSTVLCVFSATILLMMGCHSGRTESPTTASATHMAAAAVPASTPPQSESVPITTGDGGRDIPQPAVYSPNNDSGDTSAPTIHHHRYTAVQMPPACVAQGYTTYTCACGESYISDYRDALGHTYGPWVTEVQPTVSAEGRQKRSCTRCSHSETAVLSKLTNTSKFAQEVVALVNMERRSEGLPPLTEISALDNFAQTRSLEIVSRFEHVRPDGSNPLDDMMSAGYHSAGENIAAGQPTPESVMDGWMSSPTHRANILSPDFSYIGVGYCESGGYYYWVQIFAGD